MAKLDGLEKDLLSPLLSFFVPELGVPFKQPLSQQKIWGRKMTWTLEEEAWLRQLIGDTSASIASQLTTKFKRNFTRYMISGKIGHLKLSKVPDEMASTQLGIMDLQPHHCRWLVGDNHYCGDMKWRGSYCETHFRAAHIGGKS